MKFSVSRLLLGCLFATLAFAANAQLSGDAVAAAKAAVSEAQAAAQAALDAVERAPADGGADALAAAQAAAKAAKQAADAAQTALDAAASAAAAPAATPASAATTTPAADSGESTYAEHVQCAGGQCKIDLYLTRGFRAFSQCQVCHGLDANGSSFAPSLVDKLKDIDKARYVDVVTNGYTGQAGVMPAWGENPNVMKYIDNLYDYLKARSDGQIPAGKLKRYDR